MSNIRNIRLPQSKILPIDALPSLSDQLHKRNSLIVSTNGCFDLLHLGHTQYLTQARQLGDVLVCGINSDASVKRLKGPHRPIFSQEVRAKQLAALEAVDYVVIFEEETPVNLINLLRPQIHAKGADYQNQDIPEKECIEALGGKLIFLPLVPDYSTTSLIQKIKALP